MAPSDPISKFIPEFAHLKVFNGFDATGKMLLADPIHPPTMHELMTHSAGFTYGNADTPVDQMYKQLDPSHAPNLQGMIDRLAQIPLLYQPGTRWVYSMSMDIQGYIVEKLTGQSLPDFLRDNLFTPIGMRDAGFFVPADKRARFAAGYYPAERRARRRTHRQRHSHRLRHAAHNAVRRRRPRVNSRGLLPLRHHAAQ